jgi:hypothetical protein
MKDDDSSNLKELRDALHFDLEDCREDGSGLVDHPLVRAFVWSREDAVSLNKIYEAKVDLRDQAMMDRDWSAYVELHERPYRLDAFVEIMNVSSDQSYWEMLARFWIDTEYPWQSQTVWKDLWGSNRPAKQFAMSEEEREALSLLSEELTVFRGVGKGNNVEGLSWTLSREKAIWFAQRFKPRLGNGRLITATANKQDVHAFLNSRKEQEVIVDKFSITSDEKVA